MISTAAFITQDQFTRLWDSPHDYWQWGFIGTSLIVSLIANFFLKRSVLSSDSKATRSLKRFFHIHRPIHWSTFFLSIFLWIIWASYREQGIEANIVHSFALLASAISLYQITNAVTKGMAAPRIIGGSMLVILGFHLMGWLSPLREWLSNVQFSIGSLQVNIWKILSGISALFVFLWIVGLSNKFITRAVHRQKSIPPSIKVLLIKTSRLLLYVTAFLWALTISGVPLGGLAVFSGALGLGIGFGLQKVISNLVSGIIILIDKSIKPGDVIEIDGTYGWINTLNTRYVSVLTRDKKEILIPNEDFVTNKVVNWSFSDTDVRIRTKIGVAYSTDVEKAIQLCQEGATKASRVLKSPPPICLLTGFGDSSIDLDLRFWINDANQGVGNIRSAVLLEVWKLFKEHNIEIPFPQREVTVKHQGALPQEFHPHEQSHPASSTREPS